MSFEDLTVEQIADLKGEKGDKGDPGEKGDKGDPGVFNGETIGVVNILDITKFKPYNNIGQIETNVKDGVINYTNVPYYISTTVNLKKGNHVFRVKDYTSHSHLYNGKIRFHLLEASEVIYSKDMSKGELFSFNISKNGEYSVQLRISNVTQINGFIEKPMLVEGDIPVLWNMSEKDRSIYLESLKKSNYHLSNIDDQLINGTLSNPSIVILSNINSTQQIKDNKITLYDGIWLCSINTYMTPIDFNDYVNLHLYLNNEQILLSQIPSTQLKNKTLTHIFKVEGVSEFSLRTSKKAGSDEVSFTGSTQNKLSLTRLGGV